VKRSNKKVTKEEFEDFIKNYKNKLEIDINGAFEPPIKTYNDFSLGNWPESVVAFVRMGKLTYGYFKTKEENDKYCIDEYYIKYELCY
jgi:hypothetical protein